MTRDRDVPRAVDVHALAVRFSQRNAEIEDRPAVGPQNDVLVGLAGDVAVVVDGEGPELMRGPARRCRKRVMSCFRVRSMVCSAPAMSWLIATHIDREASGWSAKY